MGIRSRAGRGLFALLCLSLVATACGSDDDDGADGTGGNDATADTSDASAELTEVRLGWAGIAALPANAPYTSLPQALGYWEEEGLDVEVVGFDGSGPTIQAMDAGQMDATFAGGPPFITAVAAGTENLVSIFAQITGNPLIPVVLESSDIKGVADIAGKKVGVQSLEGASRFMVAGMLESEGEDPSSVQFIAVGRGPEAAAAIENGTVDVLALTDAEHATIENLGIELREVSNDFADRIGFQNPLIVPRDQIEANHDTFVGLARGVVKAMVFMRENPEAAIRIHWEVYPDSKPVGVSDDEAMQQALVVQAARDRITEKVEDLWGNSTDEIVQAHIDFLTAAGQLTNPVAVDDVWDPDLIEEINDIDEEAIRQEARDYQDT